MKNDLISRASAIDDLHEKDPSQVWDTADIEVWVNALPPAQPTDADIQKMQDIEQAMLEKAYECGKQDAMQWIPISEKFPQEDEDVLLQFPSNQGVGYYEDGDWMINTGDGIYSIVGYNEEKPIAWMPLPEPYRKEGGE